MQTILSPAWGTDPQNIALYIESPSGQAFLYSYGVDAGFARLGPGSYSFTPTLYETGTYTYQWTAQGVDAGTGTFQN